MSMFTEIYRCRDIQLTVRGWADSVVGKKRMFKDSLNSQIEKRQANIAKLDATWRDLENQ